MARVFITGSSDGIGRANAETLLDAGHSVVVHARSHSRLEESLGDLLERGAHGTVANLADPSAVEDLAAQVNRIGRMDAVIHNAGVMNGPHVLAVNVLAPYILSAQLARPARLIFLSSGLHRGGRPQVEDQDWHEGGTYSDSKLFLTTLAFALAARWPTVTSNAVNPGWVATKMGGRGAPDDFQLGHDTQEWLAVSDDPGAHKSGRLLFHRETEAAHPAAGDPAFQDHLLSTLGRVSGHPLPTD